MTRGILSALAVLAIAIICYGLYFDWATSGTDALASPDGRNAGLTWVKAEFELNDSEFATLKAENEQYTPRCEAMCMELAEARRSLGLLVEQPTTVAADIEVAHAKVNSIEQRCFRMTLEHIYEVSRLMKPEQGARYCKQMIARLLDYRPERHGLHSDIVRSNPASRSTK